MKKATRLTAMAGVASLLVWAVSSTSMAVDRSLLTAPRHVGGLSLAAAANRMAGAGGTVPVLLSTKQGQAGNVARKVQALGGSVKSILSEGDFVVARIPARAVSDLEHSPLVRAMGIDRPVRLDPTAMQPLAEAKEAPPSAADPAISLKVTRGEIRASQMTDLTGSDGSGTLIAVLDTGVDPQHPALLKTPAGEVKISDWQDFTGEGDVVTTGTYTAPLPGITSQSGVYRLGSFQESQIPEGEMKSDINRNGKSDDQFKVLLADTVQKSIYDTAYVDLNGNGDLSDEQPMQVYNQSFNVGTFGPAENGVHFVITRISADGSGLNIGYDGGQHGTHVAGIAAGTGPITGIAPGARIMAIKVLSSGGSGSWGGIIEGMSYAADHGAHVINMSLGGLTDENDGTDPQSLFIDDLTRRTGTLFSIAAGNSGPGLNTMGLPGVAGGAVTSGAYISKNTWKVDYGLNVPEDGLWYFSSAGPRDDGGLKPNIVSPGTANASVPTWAGSYAVFQGTSMAAPQTSGAAALLIAAAKYRSMTPRPDQVRMALELGARRLPGYGWYEQGHGLIQVDAAWTKLQSLVSESNPDLVSFGRAKPGTAGTGLYAREFSLQGKDSRWLLGNREYHRVGLELDYLPGRGLTLSGPATAALPALQKREIPLRFDHSRTPGVYDALIQARVPGQVSYAGEFLATVVVPHELDPARGNMITGMGGTLGPARYARHFVRVPAGTAELKVNVSVPSKQGRVRVMAYTPDGMPAGDSPYAGAPEGPDQQTLTIAHPQPGVWELDAYASHGAMNFDLPANKYVIDVAARGVYATPDRIDLPFASGQTLARKISFANYYDEITSVETGAGFAQPESQRLELEHGDFKDLFIDLKESTAMLRAQIGMVNDPAADMEIGLYYNDPQVGGWMQVGSRNGSRIDLLNPPAGEYAVEITARSVPSGKTGFTYSLTQVRGGDAIQAFGKPTDRNFGARWSVPVTIRVPAMPGSYLGAVTLKDQKSGKVLAVVPVEP